MKDNGYDQKNSLIYFFTCGIYSPNIGDCF